MQFRTPGLSFPTTEPAPHPADTVMPRCDPKFCMTDVVASTVTDGNCACAGGATHSSATAATPTNALDTSPPVVEL